MLTLVCGAKMAAQAAESSFVKPLLGSKGYQLTDEQRRLLEIVMLVYLTFTLFCWKTHWLGSTPNLRMS